MSPDARVAQLRSMPELILWSWRRGEWVVSRWTPPMWILHFSCEWLSSLVIWPSYWSRHLPLMAEISMCHRLWIRILMMHPPNLIPLHPIGRAQCPGILDHCFFLCDYEGSDLYVTVNGVHSTQMSSKYWSFSKDLVRKPCVIPATSSRSWDLNSMHLFYHMHSVVIQSWSILPQNSPFLFPLQPLFRTSWPHLKILYAHASHMSCTVFRRYQVECKIASQTDDGVKMWTSLLVPTPQ